MSGVRLLVTSALLGGAFSPTLAQAETGPDTPTDSATSPNITVTGVRSVTRDKLAETIATAPQSIDVISHDLMEQQATSRLADALRNVPGITLNAGEGAARGDTVNLRGFSAFNDFFLDGIRDAAIYNRDSFNLDTIEVLEGPSAVVFGRGSTGGAINQVSKAPMLAPLWSGSVVGGTNSEIRGTADVNQPIGHDSAVRINVMGERSKVTDRDLVSNHRWGVAPSLGLGLSGADTLIVSYLHQEETDVPDVGIPFINGKPAQVPRNLDYGLASDRFRSVVNIGTGYYRHKFSSDLIFSDTLRYGDYTNFNRFNAPNFGYNDSPGAPTATTPLSTVRVGRDSPSSSDHRTNLTNQTDLTARFATGPLRHTLVFGTEFSREQDTSTRYVNPFGDPGETPATPLLNPDPYEVSPVEAARTRGVTTAYGSAAYLIDTIRIGDMIDVIGGIRYDRFAAHYRPSALIAGVSAGSLKPLDHVDHQWSPRASLVFKPSAHARIYASYGTSFDPSAEALSLSTRNVNLAPVTAKSYEFGAKFDWLDGKLLTTAAIFRTQINNAQITDPDHPTQIQLAGNQRVDGAEVGLTGRITAKWEITAGYTFLNGKTLYSTTPGATGSQLANTARNSANLWTEYEFDHGIELGVGGNYLDKRYGDYAEQATLPAYVIVNAMAAWTVNEHLLLRANVNNVFNKLAWVNSYYTSAEENHVIPAPGRTALFTAVVKFR
ncbi:TonB-dependent receptor [Novosphingobium sp.]|uniref:TonB-dependent receptor n=1 Tax=Novosphingobium sp. TaxID=1874826 RepID=UPI003B5246AA